MVILFNQENTHTYSSVFNLLFIFGFCLKEKKYIYKYTPPLHTL